jgi:chromosome segregation ATPase
MDEKCREYASLSEVSKDVEELKSDVKDIDKRISRIEIDAGKRDEKINNLENLLLEIKSDVKDIKGNKQKLITGIIGGVIITVMAAFILQVFKVFHW